MMMSSRALVMALTLWLTLGASSAGWGFGSSNDPGKVLLKDVQTLTLHHGKMTTGRRGSPVPQLTCVGGSARGKFTPQVVQCYNRGWDGQDVQWECRSDMDNMFRFGNVEVVCEGYDYPDDPYITKGSCGLEYTLDYTMEGEQKAKRESHSYYDSNSNSYSGKSNYGYNTGYNSYKHSSSSGFGTLISLIVVGLLMYAFYKTCIDSHEIGDNQYSSTNDDHPRGNPGGGGGWFNGGLGGGNRGYPRNNGGYYNADAGADCGGARGRYRGTGVGGGAGGFWTGLATGGLAGYMFGGGNRGYGGYNRGYNGGWGGWGNSWGGGGGARGFGGFSGGGGGGGSSSTTSSGTRTASGFGGTRRR